MYQQIRIHLTRVFVAAVLVLLLISGSKWETTAPMVSTILFLFGCFLAAIASLGRLWCSLYIAGHKTKDLVTVGPYSICRNPLYFFSMLGGLGVGMATETLTIPALILTAFAVYYPFVIRFEENKLVTVHGEEWKGYFQTVPRFWPKWSLLNEPQDYVVAPKTFRKHIFSALWFIWIIGILELIEELHELHVLSTSFVIY